MHQCLAIVEVQRAIFHQVRQANMGLVTLAELACTCRAFNSSALDVLWETLDSFVYLIRCLPRDLWKIEPENGRMTFQRAMLQSDWEVFFRYSSRIRNLRDRIAWINFASLSDDVIFALSNPPNHDPPITYLKTLRWATAGRKYATLLRSLLTPSLVSLELSSCILHSHEASILSSISTVCPSLRNFSFPSYGPFANILNAKGKKIMSQTILNLHSLTSLTCPALDEAAIVHICHLPFLVDLSLQLRPDIQLDKVLPHVLPSAFAFLNKLKLHASTLSTLTSFLQPMRFKPTSLLFTVTNMPTLEELHLFFVTLATACGSEKLSRVSLTTSSQWHYGVPREQVTLFTFESLLLLPNIQNFEFDAPFNIALNDDAIATLAKRWPKLTRLSLNADSGWGIASRVTHHGLITLLSCCPKLSNLALAIDFSDIDMPYVEVPNSCPSIGVINDRCYSVNFTTSVIQHPGSIAVFLSNICPKLKTVESAWGYDTFRVDVNQDEADAYQKGWEEVESLLSVFKIGRRKKMEGDVSLA